MSNNRSEHPPPPPPTSAVESHAIPIAYLAQHPQHSADDRHIDLLVICHYIWAALVAVMACIPIIHVALGVAMLSGAFAGTSDPPPAFVGYLFIGMGGVAILLGWTFAVLNFISARSMRQKRRRMLSLIVAGFNCLSVPLGTALGVFTFVVLLRPSVTARYADAEHPVP